MFAQFLLKSIRHRLARRRMVNMSNLSIEDVFDKIYEQGAWSNDSGELSGSGSYGHAADEYVAFLTAFVKEQDIQSILDIGCGDFNIGARVAPHVPCYHAVDVSARIIAINKSRFASMTNVDFRQVNACTEPLVKADLVTVRQVLQHLTNAQIEMILKNIERTEPKFALITEHLSEQTRSFRPNLDLPSHTAHTRVAIGSGVVLNAPPFSRQAPLIASIALPAAETSKGIGTEVLGIFLLSPQG
jgi:2-polyprenyl-3-methyl-5-hydroxy-6-metoxy-1,4-benzoquinol methylase